MGIGVSLYRHAGAQGGRSSYPQEGPFDVVQISTGHLGWSWTVEGGVVEVYTDGASIRRAPLSNPIMSDGSRAGREWWPDREPFRNLWYPLTWATIAEAEADYQANR